MNTFLMIIGLLASFFFAGSEAAYTVFNKIRLDVWRRQGKRHTAPLKRFIDRPEDFFSTILIGNNLANILYTTFATAFLIRFYDETTAWLIITLIVLFFGEIYPKTLFRNLSDRIILPVSWLSRFFYWLFKPAIFVLNYLIDIFLDFLHIQHESVREYFSREEMEHFLRGGLRGRAVDLQRKEYISNILELSDVKVREAMTPRTEIIGAEDTVDPDIVLDLMIRHNTQQVVIYRHDLDDVRGMVFAFDLLEPPAQLGEIIHPLKYVPENKSCARLIKEFQRDNITVALVLDEYGGTAGLITMDDLVEEVFGNLYRQESEPQIKALNDHTWLIDARYDLDALNEKLALHLSAEESETLAGMILEHLGKIPRQGEVLHLGEIRIEIVKATKNRIFQIKLVKPKDKGR